MKPEIKGANRFKDKGLQHEEKLSIMFEDLRNTGDDHWCASSGVAPSRESPSFENSAHNLDDDEEHDDADDSEPEEVTPTSGQGKKAVVNDNTKGKKAKTTGGQWFQEQMGMLMKLNERTTASAESVARREDRSGCSVQDVMALVKECGATSGTDDHFIASIVFTKRVERDVLDFRDS